LLFRSQRAQTRTSINHAHYHSVGIPQINQRLYENSCSGTSQLTSSHRLHPTTPRPHPSRGTHCVDSSPSLKGVCTQIGRNNFMASWSSGMIRVLGLFNNSSTRGPGFNPRRSPFLQFSPPSIESIMSFLFRSARMKFPLSSSVFFIIPSSGNG